MAPEAPRFGDTQRGTTDGSCEAKTHKAWKPWQVAHLRTTLALPAFRLLRISLRLFNIIGLY